MGSYPVGGLSDLGWRTIASDGDFIYGTDTYSIAVWSIDEAQVVDNVVTGSIGPSGFAYDPGNGHFYLGSGNGAIEVLDRDGEEVRLVVTPYDIEGLAWDSLSPGGPYLWAWVDAGEDAPNRCQAVRLDPVTGLVTGAAFFGQDQGTLADVPGAGAVTRDLVPGKLALVGLQENDGYPVSEAFAVGYDLDVVLPPAWITLVGVTAGSVAPEAADTLAVAIHGTMADTTTAAVIRIASNDLARPLVEIPVTVAMLARLVAVSDGDGRAVPGLLVVEPNHPNPFNPVTRIGFELREPGEVRLDIFDPRGRRVARSQQVFGSAGRHEFVWDGTNEAGRPVASGVYLYTLTAGDVAVTRKMLLAK